MKPSQLELLVFKLETEFNKMKNNLMFAYINESKELPSLYEIYIDSKRLVYFETKTEKASEMIEFLAQMMQGQTESPEVKTRATEYWSATKIDPREAVLVQELKIVDGTEIIVTNSYQFKNTFIKSKLQGFENAS